MDIEEFTDLGLTEEFRKIVTEMYSRDLNVEQALKQIRGY